MYLNLGGLRKLIWAQTDHEPSKDVVAQRRLNDLINRGLWQMSEDAPGLFFEQTVELRTTGDVTMASATDTLRAVTDQWVLRTNLTSGNGRAWETGKNWAGKKIFLYDPASCSEYQERIIQDVWLDSTYFFISLDRPWHNATDTAIQWRVRSPWHMPADLVDIKAMYMNEGTSGLRVPLNWLTPGEAERRGLVGRADAYATGTPTLAWAGEWRRLPSPSFEPLVSIPQEVTAGNQWDGPEPEGQFEYMFTYVLGMHDEFVQEEGPTAQSSTAPLGQRRPPFLESGPSPITNPIDPGENGDSPGGEITITLPNVARIRGFNDLGTTRYRHTGIKKRVYRRRITDDSGELETPNTFYLMGEVDDYVTAYVDNGSVVPDHLTPFRHVNGYREVHVHPRTEDEDRAILVRCTRRPRELTDDQDSIPIAADAINCLIYLVLSYMYEAQGNHSQAALSAAKYTDHLTVTNRRHSDIRPGPRTRRSARATGGRINWWPGKDPYTEY